MKFDLNSKKWIFNGPHSEYSINLHQIKEKNDSLYNYNTNQFLEFEKNV